MSVLIKSIFRKDIIKPQLYLNLYDKYNYYFSEKKIPNGRWNNDTTNSQKEIKAMLATYDSCGDRLCGDPLKLKNEIDTIDKIDIIDKN